MSMHNPSRHMSEVARKLNRNDDKPMVVATAQRCVAACAYYLWHDDESPQASMDLQEAVKVIEQDAYNRGRAEAIAQRLVSK